jgi:RHS repeat-associated protein
VRFRDKAGHWKYVDLTLEAGADGSVAPRGHAYGLRLGGHSAAGSAESDIAVTEHGAGREVSLAWPGALPAPSLSGSRATNRNVTLGVDMVVEALRSGYEQLFVLRERPTGPVSWQLPVKTKGLTAKAEKDGSVSFVDAKGAVVSRIPAAIAWDAIVDDRSGEHLNRSAVALSVSQKGKGRAVLTVTPDAGWLADPSTMFPVTVDPTYAAATVYPSFDTFVQEGYTTDQSTATELKIGNNGSGQVARSFLNFPLSGIAGKTIMSATLSLYEFHSWSCSARSWEVWTSGAASSSSRWTAQPSTGTKYGTSTVTKGYSSSCAAGRVSQTVTGAVQGWASSGSTGALRVKATDETDPYGWKRFYSSETAHDPYISYTYDRKPNAASAPTMEAAYTASYLDPRDSTTYLFTTDSTPRFYSAATDPDASPVSITFEVHSSTTTSSSTLKASCATTGYQASGSSVSCSPTTALANNGSFYVRAAVKDDQGLWNGTWSPWTHFYTAYNNPPAPGVSCPGYSNGSWTDADPAADVTCTITAAGTDYSTAGYLDLIVDGVPQPRRTVAPSYDPAVAKTTVTFSKTAKGSHSITATAVSRALMKSSASTFSFGWGGASLTLPTVGTASSGAISVTAGGPPRGSATSVSGKVQWRVAGSGNETTGWTDGPTVAVTPPDSTTPVTATTSFALSSAVREAGATADVPTRTPVLLDVQFCFTYAGVASAQCTWSQSPRSVTRIPHAFGGGYPVADAGPGQVALFSGEFNTSATDVSVPGYSGDLAISRSHTSFDGDGTLSGWPVDPVTGVFGPGWTASLEGPDAGAAGLQVIDNTRQDGTIVLVDEEGEPLVYQNPDRTRTYKPGTPYLPVTTDTTQAAADLNISGTVGATMSLSLKEEDGTVTTWSPVAYSATADTDWTPVSVNEPGQVGATTYGHDGTGRVTRIVAAVPPNAATPPAPAVTCPTSGTLVKGCRALDISYATATTATTGTPGDYTGRVKSITATLWDPAAGAMSTTTVATYAYDTSGRLLNVTDPRNGLGTDYTWDGSSTRLASVKQTGLAAYRLAYDTTPSTPRVATVSRDNPAGSGSAVTLARYNYALPLSGTGLPDLTSDAAGDPVNTWNQASDPVSGYAAFGADYTGPISGTGVDWSRADLQYVDAQGFTVNTATYGAGAWQIAATDYDALGNTVRELDSDTTSGVTAAAAAGNPLGAGQVDALSTQTIYNSDITDTAGKVVTPAGTLVTDTYGPTRTAALVADLDGDGARDVLPVRPHTRTLYDQNAPTTKVVAGVSLNPANDEPWRLPTTVTTGVAASAASPGSPDLEATSTTTNTYTKLNASDATEGDPWVLGTPTKVTTGGITGTTRYDTEGRATETRQPLSTGSDAGTTRTIAYTAGTNPADAACGNKVEWAGLTCRTLPAAAPSAGAGGAATLPDSRTTNYTAWLQPLTVVETSGAATRTTETRYDTAGRVLATWTTTSGLTGSTARPGTFTHYRTADGLVDYTGDLNAAKTDADPVARSSTTYDAWGRALTTTNDLGDITTTAYVPGGQSGAGSVATLTENPAATGQPDQVSTYTYDGTDADGKTEGRGLLTGLTITRAGAAGGTGSLTFAAAYDAQGKLVTQKLPGQLTQRTAYDEAGEPAALTYAGTVQPVTLRLDTNGDPVTDANGDPIYDPDGAPQADQPWLAWTVVNDTQGRVATETTGPAAAFDGNPGVTDPADITPYDTGHAIGSDRQYGYDAAGRLTSVTDHTATGHGADLTTSPCKVRTYAFDANGRRTALTEATHTDGDCAGSTSVTTTSSSFNYYDTADRPTQGQGGSGQYVYDPMGRQTTLPGVDAPNQAGGNITLGYFDDDLARTITQGATSTTFTLDATGRRLEAATTTGSQTSTLVRHYTGGDDNPAWTVATDPSGNAVTTRYAETIGGDLGLTLATDGSAELTLANLHGDMVTTVPIPAAQATGAPAPGIDGWSDYTEYGVPCDRAATAAVSGPIGYGWLGTKQRSTTTESAGLTLMGDRLYNNMTGRFLQTDPIPGGSANAYAYPTDPINMYDFDGRRWGWARKAWHGARAVLNTPSTMVGLGYAHARGGSCSRSSGLTYNCQKVGGANGSGGFTIGNVWLHKQRNRDYDPHDLRGLMRHERRHSDQYAIFGGFVGFPALYGVDRAIHRNPRKSWFERWAGLRDGNY